ESRRIADIVPVTRASDRCCAFIGSLTCCLRLGDAREPPQKVQRTRTRNSIEERCVYLLHDIDGTRSKPRALGRCAKPANPGVRTVGLALDDDLPFETQ